MLTTLLTGTLAVLITLMWIGLCLLPLLMLWGVWGWLRTSAAPQADDSEASEYGEHTALVRECQALQAESKALLAQRR